ncbi:MAG: L-aspartate oxidase [Nitrospirales bacterium]|nr:L-aspartate oxidase [Nitrospira sp.]MDR4500584.1 L-aspartate oxidase [Nitrospirales bacterium]
MALAHTPQVTQIIETDFLVIGSGVAGIRAALELCHHGRVLMVAKGGPQENSTLFAQGGVAVALSEEDHVDLHFTDTMKAGHQLCRKPATKALVQEGPARIEELLEWGAKFDKVKGKLAFAHEGAHSRRRILRAGGDAIGCEMVRVLTTHARLQPNIQWIGNQFSIDLVVLDGRCCGAVILEEQTGQLKVILAASTVLTTGGAGQAYARTTNPISATGDGMAMALRAGAALEDMEFVQFHPTALYLPSSPPFLLSEAMRGEGGRLRNNKREFFMKRYHKDKELAPRDIVARAIWSEMQATKARHVYLDITHLSAGFIKKRFPTIYTTCLRYDIDITEEWIPVSPSAHYWMGGVHTDLNGATTLPGLFAAGEVACSGVHGANRLASNSLLEGLVFGLRAAQAAVTFATRSSSSHPSIREFRLKHRSPSRPVKDAEKLRNSLRRLMWTKVGLIRHGDVLRQAVRQLKQWEQTLEQSPLTRTNMETRNLITVGRCTTEAALWRKNSVGAHFRSDFPIYKGLNWKVHSRSHRPGKAKHFPLRLK